MPVERSAGERPRIGGRRRAFAHVVVHDRERRLRALARRAADVVDLDEDGLVRLRNQLAEDRHQRLDAGLPGLEAGCGRNTVR